MNLYKKDLKLGEEVVAILTKHKDYSSISSEDMEKMFDFYAFNENKPLEENLKDAKIGISNYTNAIARIEVMLNFKKNRLVEEQEKLNKVSEEIKINRNNFYDLFYMNYLIYYYYYLIYLIY